MPIFNSGAVQKSQAVGGTIVGAELDRFRMAPRAESSRRLTGRPKSPWLFSGKWSLLGRLAQAEQVTAFTTDIALLLKAGMRINTALGLLEREGDLGQLLPIVADVRGRVLTGATFAEALGAYPHVFPQTYVALVSAGEIAGSLEKILDLIAIERSRTEKLQRKTRDALRYPAFLLFAAGAVLVFFLTFVLPQFSSVLSDLNASTDGITRGFLHLSDMLSEHKIVLCLATLFACLTALVGMRNRKLRDMAVNRLGQMPLLRQVFSFQRTALFCRNLHVLHNAGVPLTATLKILAEIMITLGGRSSWHGVVDAVRHGSKLSDALEREGSLPALAIRMLRLGEDSGQLAVVAHRAADYYEAKLERTLERFVGIVGPAAIIGISTVVGGLIASVMSSLLSVTQMVG